MDYGRTFIAIRKRSLLGLLDLALLVYRDHARNLLILLAVNALPWVMINFAILMIFNDGYQEHFQWHWKLLLLTFIQAQHGTMMITLYLGSAMFEGKPSVRHTISNYIKASWYGIWLHGFLRMVFPVMALLAVGDSFATGWAVFLALIAALFRAFRPFVSEIMLLERTPVRRKKGAKAAILFPNRSQDLHRGDVFAGFLFSGSVAIAFTLMLAGLLFHIDGMIGLLGTLDLPIQYLYWPLSAWLVASFITVFRFLFYINTRITQEGWEVSLKLRSEGKKIRESLI